MLAWFDLAFVLGEQRDGLVHGSNLPQGLHSAILSCWEEDQAGVEAKV